MPAITVQLSKQSLDDLDDCAHTIKLSRVKYICRAIEHMNNEVKNRVQREHLKSISLRVRKESMRINREFCKIEHNPKD